MSVKAGQVQGRLLEAVGGGAHGQRLREEGMEMFWYGPHLGGWAWARWCSGRWWQWPIIALVRSFIRSGQRPNPPDQGYASGTGSYSQPAPAAGHAAAPEQILAGRLPAARSTRTGSTSGWRRCAPRPGTRAPTATP
jgi:hypothetical protein